MRLFEKWLWSLLMVGLLCATAIHTQDDLDEDMEDEEEEETTVEEERPAEVPVERPVYVPPVAKGNVYLTETFESEAAFKRWVISQARKEGTDDDIAKYDGQWSIEEPKDNPLLEDLGLVLKSKAKHHAVAVKLSKQFDFTGKPFIVQYEVKFQNGQECGGAYVKLLSPQKNMDLTQFHDKTPYTIMFGPDKCGNDNKLHFIFRHKNPKTGEFEEKHAKKPSSGIDTFFTDKKTHLFTLVVNPDNTFQVLVDQKIVSSGSLLEDVDPPVNPAKEIVDPDDKKPEDWDEREKIPDPEAKKPEDWDESEPQMIVDKDATMPEGWLEDEPELIPDPDADKPTDWDEEMDGEWEAPMISNPACESAPGCGDWEPPQIKNPKYKGKWKPPMIDNPNYQGKWKPRNIPNPDYFEDLEPHKMTPIVALGLELWSMSDDLYFDNFIITDDKNVADQWAADSWELKIAQEMAGSPSGKSVVQAVMDATNERPWLWAVFILVVVLPIVLVFYYCCVSGSKPEDIARIKKTDEASPDDAEEEEDEQEEEDKGGSGDASSAKKASKSALEADADAEDDEAEPEERRSSPRKKKKVPTATLR